jgi:hypothetical protein
MDSGATLTLKSRLSSQDILEASELAKATRSQMIYRY